MRPMSDKSSVVAAIQMVSVQDPKINQANAIRLIQEAARKEAKIVVLPEAFLTYLTSAPPSAKEQSDFIKTFASVANLYNIWLVAGTYPLFYQHLTSTSNLNDKKPFAMTVVFSPEGNVISEYAKIHLFDVNIKDKQSTYRESDEYQAGRLPASFQGPNGKIGLATCFDIRFPELFSSLVKEKCKIFCIPSAFTEETGIAHWEILLKARAIDTQSFIIAANQGGEHSSIRKTYGNSMIIDPWGNTLAQMNKGEGVITASLDFSQLEDIRTRMPLIHKVNVDTLKP